MCRPLTMSICLLLSFACSDPYLEIDGTEHGGRFVVKERLGAVNAFTGETCAVGCVWSSFAVALGVQAPTHYCSGAECTCVEDGNIHATCLADVDGANSEQETPTNFPEPTFDVGDNVSVGDSCASGCIWSSYAVTMGAQSEQARCDVGPCACVLGGNVWLKCNPGDGLANDSEEPSESQDIPAPAPAPRTVTNTEVPYFCQFRNQLQGWATCQNTSVAMMLKKHGWRGTPDDITRRYGRFTAQSPGGLANVFNLMASGAGLSVRATPITNGTIGDLRGELQAGRPVIVHGYFTNGHVIVVTGYDGNGYYANDPAGRWNQQFRGGYPNGCYGSEGKGVYYGKAAFEKAISTAENGYTSLPIWFHKIR